MKTVGELVLREAPVVEPESSLTDAMQLLRESPLQTVILVGDDQFMGVFNQAALQSNLIPADADPNDLTIGPYIHPVRLAVDPATPIDLALKQARHRGVTVVPVVRGATHYLGVVTVSDLEAGLV